MTLSIIILSYNTKNLLENTIRSIPITPHYEIIVVDNGSSDGSPELIKKEFPQVKLIRLPQNLGFAAGNNIGIKVASGRYVMLLNSDTEIIGNAIDHLLKYLETHPEVGIITPKIILPNGNIDLACHRGMPTPWNAFTYFTHLEAVFPHSPLTAGYHQLFKNLATTHPIEATAATAMIVRRSVIDRIGLLDEQFFFYAEDLDWCKRTTEAGFIIMYYPKAKVLHHKGQSGKRKDDAKLKRQSQIHFYDTMKQFYLKHYMDKYPHWVKTLSFFVIDLKKYLSTKL